MRTSHTDLLVSGICKSSTAGSVMAWQGAPSFSPLVWAVGLSDTMGSGPEAGAATPLGGIAFLSVVSFSPSAFKHRRARKWVVWGSVFATVELVTT